MYKSPTPVWSIKVSVPLCTILKSRSLPIASVELSGKTVKGLDKPPSILKYSVIPPLPSSHLNTISLSSAFCWKAKSPV